MKIVKMRGGLGNQLFCLALVHSIAALTGETVAIDLAAYQSDRYGHGFDLGDLAKQLGGLVIASHPILGARATTAVMRMARSPGYVSERAPPADAAAMRALAMGGVYFNGYWQNEAYIAEPEDLRRQVRRFLLEKGGSVDACDVVIHCRTYKEEIRVSRRRIPDAAYFKRALAAIEARGDRIGEVVLVSDDPALAREHIGEIGRPVTVAPGRGPWADMALLLQARHLILSNSSFSWWGGFCGEAQIAVYPARGALFHYPHPAARFTVI